MEMFRVMTPLAGLLPSNPRWPLTTPRGAGGKAAECRDCCERITGVQRFIEQLRRWLRYRRILATLENETLDAGYRANEPYLRKRARRIADEASDRGERV